MIRNQHRNGRECQSLWTTAVNCCNSELRRKIYTFLNQKQARVGIKTSI